MITHEVSKIYSVNQESIEFFPCQFNEKWHSGTWVKLSNLPESCYFDEAILLCQESEHRWLAWLPEWGQIVLYAIEV